MFLLRFGIDVIAWFELELEEPRPPLKVISCV